MPTLNCIPQSLCGWDFHISGVSAGTARLDHDYFAEQGEITLGRTTYAVRKHGPFSGYWRLECKGQTVASARKPSVLFREFEVEAGRLRLVLKAHSFVGQSFGIYLGDNEIGDICPVHSFTRRARASYDARIPEPVVLFVCWLVILMWKREAESA